MAEVGVVQILASKLRSVGVITDRGLQLGKVNDIIFDEKDGKIISLIVKPTSREVLGTIQRDESGNALVPFSAVMSIRDYVVVNERILAIQQLKAQPKTASVSPPPSTPLLPPKE